MFAILEDLFKRAKQAFRGWLSRLVSPVGEFVQEYIVGRWNYFHRVRRFAFGWLAFVAVLAVGGLVQTFMLVNSQQKAYPVPGGRLREGVVGELINFNPLFAETEADLSAASLMFSSLLEYDDNGELQPELAESFKANDAADVYTVVLRDNLQWHNGQPLTAADVVFTVELMQNPRLGVQQLLNTWTDVKVEQKDERTVVFKLPNSLAPFPSLLRFKVVPKHILADQPVESLRSSPFNQQPIGSGPFKFDQFKPDESLLSLESNQEFFAGAPLLERYQLQAYTDTSTRDNAMDEGQIDFYASTQPSTENDKYQHHNARLSRTLYLFFNMRDGYLTNKVNLRRALTQAMEPAEFSKDYAQQVQGLLLTDQLPLADKYHQLSYNPEQARKRLDKLGWTNDGASRVRTNSNDKQLRLTLIYADRDHEQQQARQVRDLLRKVGVGVDLIGLDQVEFTETVLVDRKFDLVLTGVDSGIDPDVFVYWHSSQTDVGGLNISGIRDDELDRALAAGRTRSSQKLRTAKYQTAALQWRKQAPAVALAQDNFHIVSRPRVRAYDGQLLSTTIDRYYDVEQWTAQVIEQLPANYETE